MHITEGACEDREQVSRKVLMHSGEKKPKRRIILTFVSIGFDIKFEKYP